MSTHDEYPAIEYEIPTEIEVSAGVQLFYRFDIHGRPSPLKFIIESSSSYEMLLSTVDQCPVPSNYEIRVMN